jgi:hypothetical protein
MRSHTQPPSQKQFLSALSASMHEMAQPLSTIQASLELALLCPTTVEQYRWMAEDALMQLQRVVESMQFTAQLTRFQQPAADTEDVLLSATLDEVVSDLQRTFDSAQLQILFSYSKHEKKIRISRSRLRQMLFYVLQAVQGSCQPGDLVKIEIQASEGHVVLRVQHSPSDSLPSDCPKKNSVIVQRALALANAIVSNAGGDFTSSDGPFLIVADFPMKRDRKTAALDKNSLSQFAGSPLAVNARRWLKTS